MVSKMHLASFRVLLPLDFLENKHLEFAIWILQIHLRHSTDTAANVRLV